MSAHVAAGVSAAGRAADRLRVQLVQRASAIKAMIYMDEAEQETSQVTTIQLCGSGGFPDRSFENEGPINASAVPAQCSTEPHFWWAASCLGLATKIQDSMHSKMLPLYANPVHRLKSQYSPSLR
jgi:hypothetical protein